MKKGLEDLDAQARLLPPEKRAQLLRRLREDASRPTAPRLKRIPHDGRAPISHNQLMVWHWQQRHPNEQQFNILWGILLRGPLDMSALDRAVDEILRRHETLRTTFALVDGEPWQIISPPPTGALEHFVPAGRSAEECSDLAHASVAAEYHRAMNLTQGPLARFLLHRISDREHLFAWVMHRIIFDGNKSLDLQQELLSIYDAYSRQEASPLAEPALQYSDYVSWHRQLLSTEPFQARITERRRGMLGAKPVPLLYDRPSPPLRSVDVHGEPVPVSPALFKRIEAFAASESSTGFVVFLAGLNAFLSRLTGETDIVVVGPSKMPRDLAPELVSLLGRLTDLFILRTDVSGDPTFRELVRREKAVVQTAYRDADIPGVLVLQDDAALNSPFARVLFNWLDVGSEGVPPKKSVAVAAGGLSAEPVLIRGRRMLHRFADFVYVVVPRDPVFSLLAAPVDLFEASTLASSAKLFRDVLEGAVAKPDTPLSHLLDG